MSDVAGTHHLARWLCSKISAGQPMAEQA